MRTFLSFLFVCLSLTVAAQTKKAVPPIITAGTVLVYDLTDWREQGDHATLIVKITDISSGIRYDWTIVDEGDRQKNGSMQHTQKQLQKLDTLAGFNYICEPGIDFNFLSLWISKDMVKKALKGETISLNIEGGNDHKLSKGNDTEEDVNLHPKFWNRDTVYTSDAYYVHGKKIKFDVINLHSNEAVIEVWNNPAQPLVLWYSITGLGHLQLRAIL